MTSAEVVAVALVASIVGALLGIGMTASSHKCPCQRPVTAEDFRVR